MKWIQLLALGIALSNALWLGACGGRSTGTNGNSYQATPVETPQLSSNRPKKSRLRTRKAYGPKDPTLRSQFEQVQRGMSYDQVVQIFGEPSTSRATHKWETMEGVVEIVFDKDQAQYLRGQRGLSAAKRQEIITLVRQRVSFNAISANLGAPDSTSARRAVWEIGREGKMTVSFDRNDRVLSRGWSRR